MFKSNDEEDGNTSKYDKEPLHFNPHELRFMTPLCHVAASSASEDLLVIHTSTTKDTHLKALVDSGATKNCVPTLTCEGNYSLPTNSVIPFVFDSPMVV